GINRIRHDHISEQRNKSLKQYIAKPALPLADISQLVPAQFESLRVLGDRISHFPLCDGNHIQMLVGGDQAYPAMISAIEQASKSVALQSYIFDNDSEGRKVVEALARAVARGV